MNNPNWRHVVGPVTAYFCAGIEARRYDTLEEAVRLGRPQPSLYFRPYRARYFTDADGVPIPEWKIDEVLSHLSTYWHYPYRGSAFDFRRGPVPNIHCRRGGRHYYRRIATSQELCENDFLYYDEDAVEHRIQPRPARRRGTLPTLRDDGRFARRGQGWKNYRETQYRQKRT